MLVWISNGTANSSSSGFCAPLNSCEIKYEVLNSGWEFSIQNIELPLGQHRKMKTDFSQQCAMEVGEAMTQAETWGNSYKVQGKYSHLTFANHVCQVPQGSVGFLGDT